MHSDTIAAISTPSGRGGIGIIRISGKEALDIALNCFNPATGDPNLISHTVCYGHIVDSNKTIVDEVLCIYMKGPRSYTAEDIVEIQSHSSPVVLRSILQIIFENGARPAEPGEFTKRAYLNGRIDLTQAEAVIDIINARSKISHDMAVNQIKGGIKTEINDLIDELENLKIKIEAVVDFPDDVDDIIDTDEYRDIINNNVINKINTLEKNYTDMDIFRDGIRIIIAGPPNSGKSSLINALLNKDKSIVTSVPGTTRDIIEDFISIDGIPFVISDTAGLQETDDVVENIGIEKTKEELKKSDIIIIMFDGITSLTQSAITMLENLHQENSDKRIIIVQNKTDQTTEIENGITLQPDIKISVLKSIGLNRLKKRITDIIISDSPENKNSIIPNTRHYALLKKVRENCESIIMGFDNDLTYDLVSIELTEAIDRLYEITGKIRKTDVLDGIFNNFCIGK